MSSKKTKDQIEDAQIVDDENTIDVESQEVHTEENYSPFDEPVTERDYTKANIDPSQIEGELEEPTFEPPSFADFDEASDEPDRPFNPQYNELGKKEKDMGADMVADVVIDGYSRLKKGLGGLATISEGKLEREFAEGNIDPNIQLPVDEYGNTVGIREFVSEFNESSKEAFNTTDDFKEKVKPPLVRVFKKRGVGMTDEQLLLYYFGTDLVTSGATAFALKKSANGMLEQLRQQTDLMRGQGTPPPPAPNKSATQSQSENNTTQEASTDVYENQDTYSEPEEVYDVQPDVVANKKSSNSNFSSDVEVPDNMPEFGDPAVLNEIEKIASAEEKTKKRRGRPKKKK